MAYRNDVDALAARHAALEAEVAGLTRERDEAAQLLSEARAAEEQQRKRAERAARAPARGTLAVTATLLGVLVVSIAAGYRVMHHRRDTRAEVALATLAEFTDQMCACKVAECTHQVSDEMTRWATQAEQEWRDMPAPDEATLQRATAIAKRLTDCMTKAMTVSGPQ